jgi:uncharacterized protein YgiB involved in biofilm formation
MKKSSYVLLTLMGAVALYANVGRQPNVVRDVYNNRDDCVHDYSETQCRNSSGGTTGSGGRWYGPSYNDNSDEARRTKRTTERETVKRGGFGSTSYRSSGT